MMYMHPLMVVSMHCLIFIFWERKDNIKAVVMSSYSLLLYLQKLKSIVFQEQLSLKINLNYLFISNVNWMYCSYCWLAVHGDILLQSCLFMFIFILSKKKKRPERIKSSIEEWNWFGMAIWSVVIGEVLKPAKTAKRVERHCKSTMCKVWKETKETMSGWFLSWCFLWSSVSVLSVGCDPNTR